MSAAPIAAFHAVPSGIDIPNADNVRRFEGDGSAFLRVPNCLEVYAVKVGFTDIPAADVRSVPVDLDHKRHIDITFEGFSLSSDANGEPILLRSITSNDGVWQKGQPVFVTGLWADEPSKTKTK